MEVVIIMGLFDKFKRKIPPMVQIFYNQDFGFLIVPNAVEKTMGCHISIEPTEKVMPDCSSDDLGNAGGGLLVYGMINRKWKCLKWYEAAKSVVRGEADTPQGSF